MTKYAVIKNGSIVNLIEADETFVLDGFDLIEETTKTGEAHISGTFENGVFVPPVYSTGEPTIDPSLGIPAPSLGDA